MFSNVRNEVTLLTAKLAVAMQQSEDDLKKLKSEQDNVDQLRQKNETQEVEIDRLRNLLKESIAKEMQTDDVSDLHP